MDMTKEGEGSESWGRRRRWRRRARRITKKKRWTGGHVYSSCPPPVCVSPFLSCCPSLPLSLFYFCPREFFFVRIDSFCKRNTMDE
jgi:hypothetical protein